jgi:hypothetical protein
LIGLFLLFRYDFCHNTIKIAGTNYFQGIRGDIKKGKRSNQSFAYCICKYKDFVIEFLFIVLSGGSFCALFDARFIFAAMFIEIAECDQRCHRYTLFFVVVDIFVSLTF